MAIKSYAGIDAPCVNVESTSDLLQAIDLLHTQVMDALAAHPAYDALLAILSEAMDKVQSVAPDAEYA